MNQQEKLKKGQKLAEKAAIIVALLAITKAIIGFLSNSLVLLSDAIHSASDLLPVFASWAGLKIAQKKPDERFSYGYYKAENLATAAISVLILYAAYEIFTQGLARLQTLSEIKMPLLALAVSLTDAFLLYLFGRYQQKVGYQINSQSLATMGRENKAHLFSSLAVFAGILFASYQIPYGEGLITIAISFLILFISLSAGKNALFALMDVSPSQAIEKKVIKAIETVPGIEDYFDLRLRKSGPFIFGETKVGIRKSVDVQHAHQISDTVESKIKKQVPQIDSFTIHIEPFQSDYRHLVLPVLKKQKFSSPLSPKFGRAPYFLFVNLKGNQIKGYYFMKNPFKNQPLRAGLSAAKLISQQKSDTLITQEIGEIAFHALRDNLFDLYQSKAKTTQEAIKQFIKGKLKLLHQPTQTKE